MLVLQLLGKKKWQVYESSFRLPLENVPPLPFEDDRAALKRARGVRQRFRTGSVKRNSVRLRSRGYLRRVTASIFRVVLFIRLSRSMKLRPI